MPVLSAEQVIAVGNLRTLTDDYLIKFDTSSSQEGMD